MRCERSATPVRVGVNTLCPRFCRRSATRRQHQPPCQAPCTSTKVFGAPVCAGAGALPKAAALAPTPALASTPRRVIATSLVAGIVSSLRVVCWPNLTWGASVRPERRERKTRGHASLDHPTRPPDPLWITGTIRRRPGSVRRGPILGGPANHQASLHALSASVPRRAARAASGFGGRRPARAAQEGGARVEGALAL